MSKQLVAIVGVILLVAGFACTKHQIESDHKVEVAPIKVEPIHITIDVNIKVDRELEDFFGEIDEAEEAMREQ